MPHNYDFFSPFKIRYTMLVILFWLAGYNKILISPLSFCWKRIPRWFLTTGACHYQSYNALKDTRGLCFWEYCMASMCVVYFRKFLEITVVIQTLITKGKFLRRMVQSEPCAKLRRVALQDVMSFSPNQVAWPCEWRPPAGDHRGGSSHLKSEHASSWTHLCFG